MPEVWNAAVPSGARWRTVYKYRDSYAANGSSTQVWIECDWARTPEIRQDFLGYATWDRNPNTGEKNKYLTRVVPLAAPYSGGGLVGEGEDQVQLNPQRCLRMDLELFYPTLPDAEHVYPAWSPGGDPHDNNQWLSVDGYVHYQCTFGPTPYYVLTDDQVDATIYTGGPGEVPPESKRFVRVTRRYMPEARKTPSAGFECYDPTYAAGPPQVGFRPFVIQEVGFIPTFQIEIVAELIEWPVEAYPDTGIAECLGCVNDATVYLMGKSYGPGTLLYKGPAREMEVTDSAAGYKIVNVPHLFGYRSQTWNAHRLNSGDWKPLVVKGTVSAAFGGDGDGTLKPMFKSADFQKLFQPG